MIEVGLLGPLVVNVDDQRVELSGGLEQALLARLALTAGHDVSRHRLIDDLWGEAPPTNAVGSLQTLVYRLRRTLGSFGSAITLTGSGYLFDSPEDCVDALRFSLLVDRARRSSATCEARRELLCEALGLWRGTAFAGLDGVQFVAAQRAALEAARVCTLGERIEADLAAGFGAELVAELEGLVAEHPLEEKLWGQLMVALYRAGSQAAALRCYGRLRKLLAEELGIEPSPAVAALERAILCQDPSLVVREQARRVSAPKGDSGGVRGEPRLVTILVTNLEARASLWEQHHSIMASAIRRCDELLADVVLSHRGQMLSRVDGSSYSAFDEPSDALGAVIEFQLSVSEEQWGAVERLPVTTVVHTGEVEVSDGNIFGSVFHVAAQLAQAGYGGQVVLTAATAELVHDGLPGGCELLDLGHWSLPDVARPVHAYELRHRDLGRAFRSLRAGRPGTGTLPMSSTSFVGREAELDELARLLAASPLVTLTGVGGVGKTRLALEFGVAQAASFPGGAWFCSLSWAKTEDEVAERVASALGLQAASSGELRVIVTDRLRFAHALLIVDNCEHVSTQVAAVLGPALAHGASTRLLLTSRCTLGLAGERLMRVDPLQRPESPAGALASQHPGVELLVERARAAGATVDAGDFSLSEIVERVNGLPLAIEPP